MSSTKHAPPAAATEMSSSKLLNNEDVLILILGWCPLKSIGRMGQCCKALRSLLSDPHQTFWIGHLFDRLDIPSREVGNANIDPNQSAKSLLKAHVYAESSSSLARAPSRDNAACWDYHRDDEPTLSIEATNGGWDTYKIDHTVNRESRRYDRGHDFAARYRRRIPHVPCPVVRRRTGGNGKILDVGLSSISFFEIRLEARNGQRQRRPNALPGDGEEMVQLPSQACVAIGLCTSSFRLYRYQPGWTEESCGYHSDDGRLFFGSGTDSMPFGPSYSDGDTIGCGVHIPSMSLFFTKNGSLIGTAYAIIKSQWNSYRELYPSIGLDSKEFTIHAQFGADEAFVYDVSKAERLYDNYPPPLRLSARLSSRSGRSADDPSDILERIGLKCAYPEASSFHPWNKTSSTRRIYVQQRDLRHMGSYSDESDEDEDDHDIVGIIEHYGNALEAMLSDGYDYVSYDDSTYGSGGDIDDDDENDDMEL